VVDPGSGWVASASMDSLLWAATHCRLTAWCNASAKTWTSFTDLWDMHTSESRVVDLDSLFV